MYKKFNQMYTQRYKKTIALILTFLLFISPLLPAYGSFNMPSTALTANAASYSATSTDATPTDATSTDATPTDPATPSDAATPTVPIVTVGDTTYVKLYNINNKLVQYNPDVKIPPEYPTSVQLKVNGVDNVKYEIGKFKEKTFYGYSSVYMRVSDDGLVTIYDNGKYYSRNGDTAKIKLYDDNGIYLNSTVEVELIDYAEVYANRIIDDYIKNNINENMTAYEKLCKVCDFAVSYDNNGGSYWAGDEFLGFFDTTTEMIAGGGGSCEASENTIIKMMKMLGYNAWIGASNGNAIVQIGDKYYECSVGGRSVGYIWYTTADYITYVKDKYYTISDIDKFLLYRKAATPSEPNADEWEIYGYNGNDEIVNIPETIDGKKVTSISESAFRNCKSLKKIVIPDTVEYIGNSAFYDCSNLEEVTLSSGLKNIQDDAFRYCSSLKKIEIPDTVEYIGSDAFYDCSNLEEVTLPSGLKSIEDDAFEDCKSLKKIEIPDTVEYIGNWAFYGCSNLEEVTLPSGLKRIEGGAFRYCSSLKKIEIPDTVEYISNGAFDGCTSLKDGLSISKDNKWYTLEDSIIYSKDMNILYCAPWASGSIIIPSTVTKIEDYAFSSYDSLTSITIPTSVKTIGDSAFSSCNNLSNVTIQGSGLESIGDSAFSSCGSLISITIPSSVKTIGNYAFHYCNNLSNVTIQGSGLESIGDYAFYECDSLISITIPSSVKTIGNCAFYYCDNLSNVTIQGNGLESIGDSAFSSCGSLISITIPSSVKAIGDYAFSWCGDLSNVTIQGNGLESIGGDAFSGCDSLTSIIIPSSVKTIGYGAFSGCDNLSNVTIQGSGLESIESYAFNCDIFQEIRIPNSVKYIAEDAFFSYWERRDILIMADEGSVAAEYAKENGLKLAPYDHVHNFTSKEVYAPTYFERGYTKRYCADCDFYYCDNYIDKLELSAPSGLEAAYVGEDSITLNWQPVDITDIGRDNFSLSYGVYYQLADENYYSYRYTDTNTFTVEELEPDTEYNFYVITEVDVKDENDDCWELDNYIISDKSEILTVTTKAKKGKIENTDLQVTNLQVTETTPSTITLGWNKVDDAVGYVVYREENGELIKLAETENNTYTDTGLAAATTYNYEVKAYFFTVDDYETKSITSYQGVITFDVEPVTKQVETKKSAAVSGTTNALDVKNFKISKITEDSIILQWDKLDGATGYIIYREINGEFVKIGETISRAYLETDLTPGTAYNYAVKAYYTNGETTVISKEYTKLETAAVTALAKVENFKAAKTTANNITLTWDKYSGASGYTLYRMIGGKWKVIAKPTENTYTDTGLIPGTVYKYAVKANAVVNGQNITSAAYPTVEAGTALTEVQNFKVAKTTDNAIKLQWSKLDGAEGYIVYKKVNGKWKNLGTTETNSFVDKKLAAATAYTYAVRGYYEHNSAIIRSESYPQITGITNLSEVKNFAVNKYNTSAIKLAWSKLKGADGYVVYRMVNGKWKRISITSDNYYLDKNLNSGTGYQYAVKAYKKVDGKNVYSVTYPTVDTSTGIDTVKFTVTAGKKQATLKWSAVTGATGYIVYYKTSANGSWTKLAATKGKSYTKTGLTSGKTYYFTVKAYRVYNGKTYNAAYTTKSAKIK